MTLTNQKVNEATEFARAFREAYYNLLDERNGSRADLLSRYFPDPVPHALMNWNGHVLPTVDAIQAYLANLPKTHHKVQNMDVQPLPGSSGADSIVITVTGSCTYDDAHERAFFQRFTVCHHNGRAYIANDYYRWTGDK